MVGSHFVEAGPGRVFGVHGQICESWDAISAAAGKDFLDEADAKSRFYSRESLRIVPRLGGKSASPGRSGIRWDMVASNGSEGGEKL